MTAILEELTKCVCAGNVVVVAGTGVSIAACADQRIDGFAVARWDGLLLHGVHHCVEVERVLEVEEGETVRRNIQAGTSPFLIGAAELIAKHLQGRSAGTYRGWLDRTLGQLRCVDPSVPHALAALGGVLATLSYDGLLEQATGRAPVTWLERDGVGHVLRGAALNKVLHLHGHYGSPESVVFGSTSYEKVGDDDHASQVLRVFALDRTLLFVGCGGTVTDPNFSRLIGWARGALKDSTHRHFLLCIASDLKKVQQDLKSVPWLYPVAYGQNFADLAPFLQTLKGGLASAAGIAATGEPPAPEHSDRADQTLAVNRSSDAERSFGPQFIGRLAATYAASRVAGASAAGHGPLDPSDVDVLGPLIREGDRPPLRDTSVGGTAGYRPFDPSDVDALEQLTRERDRPPPGDTSQAAQRRQAAVDLLAGKLKQIPTARAGDEVVGCRLLRILGKGNFGTVWQATHGASGDDRAVKVFDSDRLGLGLSLYHFRRGVRAMEHLEHQTDGRPASIVCLHEVDDAKLAFSMRYVDGGNLDHRMKQPWELSAKLGVFRTICQAVQFAHDHAVLHRDIKPANIVMTLEGDPVLTDFDIADLLFVDTQSVRAAGTVRYSAPEQFDKDAEANRPDEERWKKARNPTGDVFSLGRLLHFMVQGKDPELRFEDVPRLDELAAMPEGLVRIIRKCTLRDPAKRYPRVAELIADLDKHASQPKAVGVGLVEPNLPATPAKSREPIWRNGPFMGVIAALVALIGVLAPRSSSEPSKDRRVSTDVDGVKESPGTPHAEPHTAAGGGGGTVATDNGKLEVPATPDPQRSPLPAAGSDRYTVSSSGTVYDTQTKLTWQREVPAERYSQAEGVWFCKNLRLDGRGWRLPTKRELESIVDIEHHPAIDSRAFPNTPWDMFWSSSPYVGSSGVGWYVDFGNGYSSSTGTSYAGRVRCVR